MLVFAGICDAFDGTFARKFNDGESLYGISLDSLADICTSGILPIIISMSLGHTSIIDIIVYVIFIICGITRLTYYNVKSTKDNCFSGVPITFSAIAIPLVYIITKNEIAYIATFLILSILYVTNIKIEKPSLREKIALAITGIVFVAYVIIFKCLKLF